MLNCTDLACVLHHHHFYAHLHHLKHHLQDDSYGTGVGAGIDLNNDEDTKSNINDTESDLSSSSHLDAPNGVLYMVCGVVIAMVLVGVIIVLVAVTINKLRKREESLSATPTTIEVQEQQRSPQDFGQANIPSENLQQTEAEANNNVSISKNSQRVAFVRTSGAAPGNVGHGGGGGFGGDVTDAEWTFPPKAPTPHIYHCITPEFLVASSDKNGFKGFRKQFSGRFKRLVARKPDPVPVIPPELKPQLKTIYVY